MSSLRYITWLLGEKVDVINEVHGYWVNRQMLSGVRGELAEVINGLT